MNSGHHRKVNPKILINSIIAGILLLAALVLFFVLGRRTAPVVSVIGARPAVAGWLTTPGVDRSRAGAARWPLHG